MNSASIHHEVTHKSHHRRHHRKKPRWIDDTLAGRKQNFYGALYDPKRGWYLVHGADCGGASGYFFLTRDRERLRGQGFQVDPPVNQEGDETESRLHFRHFRNLATGNGVAIGQSPAKLVARLGRPKEIEREGSRKQFLVYRYSWKSGNRETDGTTTQQYVFKKGKLIEIEYDHSSNMAG